MHDNAAEWLYSGAHIWENNLFIPKLYRFLMNIELVCLVLLTCLSLSLALLYFMSAKILCLISIFNGSRVEWKYTYAPPSHINIQYYVCLNFFVHSFNFDFFFVSSLLKTCTIQSVFYHVPSPVCCTYTYMVSGFMVLYTVAWYFFSSSLSSFVLRLHRHRRRHRFMCMVARNRRAFSR